MDKKRILLLLASSVAIVALCVSTTYALLMSESRSLINTFVSGNIELSLTESTGSRYTLVPGCTVKKDPRITVKDGSEECWLFFKLEDRVPDGVVNYSIADGWTALNGAEGVYWRRVAECREDKVYSILKGDCFTVVPTATEDKLATLGDGVKLVFTAYAVQYEGISTPEKAWLMIGEKGDEA